MSSSCFCQTKRAKTMADAYKANYEYMLQSPLMQELNNKNKKLERANMALVRVIIRLSNDLEKQGKATKRSNLQTANIDELDDDVSGLSTSNAEMTEPIIVHKLDANNNANNNANNDVNDHSPNIVYELQENVDDEEEEEEEAEGCDVEGEEEDCEVEVEEVAADADEVIEEETEVVEITIRGKKYFTTNTTNGEIYAMDANGDVGDEVGQFVNGSAKFTKK